MIDEIDRRIIAVLQQNSRLSFYKIADQAGVSSGTVYHRVKNLEDQGVLKGYTAILNTDKLGYDLTAIILIQTEGGLPFAVESEIAKSPNTVAVYDLMGEYDLAIIAKFKDKGSLSVFVKNLLAIPHVKRTLTNVALDIIKEDPQINPFVTHDR